MYDYFIGPDGVFNTPLTAILFTALQFTFMATESRRRRAAPSDATRATTKAFPPLFLALLVGLFARPPTNGCAIPPTPRACPRKKVCSPNS